MSTRNSNSVERAVAQREEGRRRSGNDEGDTGKERLSGEELVGEIGRALRERFPNGVPPAPNSGFSNGNNSTADDTDLAADLGLPDLGKVKDVSQKTLDELDHLRREEDEEKRIEQEEKALLSWATQTAGPIRYKRTKEIAPLKKRRLLSKTRQEELKDKEWDLAIIKNAEYDNPMLSPFIDLSCILTEAQEIRSQEEAAGIFDRMVKGGWTRRTTTVEDRQIREFFAEKKRRAESGNKERLTPPFWWISFYHVVERGFFNYIVTVKDPSLKKEIGQGLKDLAARSKHIFLSRRNGWDEEDQKRKEDIAKMKADGKFNPLSSFLKGVDGLYDMEVPLKEELPRNGEEKPRVWPEGSMVVELYHHHTYERGEQPHVRPVENLATGRLRNLPEQVGDGFLSLHSVRNMYTPKVNGEKKSGLVTFSFAVQEALIHAGVAEVRGEGRDRTLVSIEPPVDDTEEETVPEAEVNDDEDITSSE